MQKQQKKNQVANGYFTVEATMIMSITVVCIVLLIYLGFYQYNRCLIGQDVYRLALKGSIVQFIGNEEIYQKVSKEYQEYYWDKYISMKLSDAFIEVNAANVSVEIEGKMQIPFSFGRDFYIKEKRSSKRMIPTEKIKIFRKLQSE